MIIDIIAIILLVLAIIKGYQRGLIVGVFSFLAILIGLAAAIKLSTVVATHLGKAIKISEAWLPFISFAIVFIVIVLLVRLGANLLQKAVEISMMGWINRLGGILFYLAIYLVVYSVVLFYTTQLHLIKPETIATAATYDYIEPWGPRVIDGFGTVLPFFKDMFNDLKSFFGAVADKIS
jgi:membrane protein required for colicin V production